MGLKALIVDCKIPANSLQDIMCRLDNIEYLLQLGWLKVNSSLKPHLETHCSNLGYAYLCGASNLNVSKLINPQIGRHLFFYKPLPRGH